MKDLAPSLDIKLKQAQIYTILVVKIKEYLITKIENDLKAQVVQAQQSNDNKKVKLLENQLVEMGSERKTLEPEIKEIDLLTNAKAALAESNFKAFEQLLKQEDSIREEARQVQEQRDIQYEQVQKELNQEEFFKDDLKQQDYLDSQIQDSQNSLENLDSQIQDSSSSYDSYDSSYDSSSSDY